MFCLWKGETFSQLLHLIVETPCTDQNIATSLLSPYGEKKSFYSFLLLNDIIMHIKPQNWFSFAQQIRNVEGSKRIVCCNKIDQQKTQGM